MCILHALVGSCKKAALTFRTVLEIMFFSLGGEKIYSISTKAPVSFTLIKFMFKT